MEYKLFKKTMNEKVSDNEVGKILKRMGAAPSRFTGVFRLGSPVEKLMQNALTSKEIKLGNALEKIIADYLADGNLEPLPRRTEDGAYDFDQLFIEKESGRILFIEQKVRDDHDSTKKKGQIQNFLEKKKVLTELYPDSEIVSAMWFIDDTVKKNQKYYLDFVEGELFYGAEINEVFEEFPNSPELMEIYDDLVKNMITYKEDISNASGSLNIEGEGECEYDLTILTAGEIVGLLSNHEIVSKVLPLISPTGAIYTEFENVLSRKINNKNKKRALELIMELKADLN